MNFGDVNATNQYGFGVSSQGNTSGVTGTVNGQLVLVGGNNITLSQSTNATGATVTISNPPGGGAGDGWNLIAAGTQTANSTGTILFNNSNGITFGMSNNSVVTASHNGITSQTVQTQNLHNLTLSGNTAGAMAHISSGTLTLAGGNNVTLSQAGNAVTISAANTVAQSVQTENMVSVNGSTGNISLATGSSLSSSSNGSTITFGLASNITTALQSAGAYLTTARASNDGLGTATAGTNVTWTANSNGLSINAAGYAGTGTTFNGANVSGSLTLNSNGLQASMSVAAPGGGAGNTFSSTVIGMDFAWAQSSSSLGQNSVYIQPHIQDQALSAIAIKVPVMITNSSLASSSGQIGHTIDFGIYSRNATNSTVLTQHYSTSYTAALSNSSNASRMVSLISGIGNSTSYNSFTSSSAGLNLSSIVHGGREFLMPVSSLLSAGEYWFAYRQSTSGGGTSNSVFAVSNIIWSSQTGGAWGATSATSLGGIAKDIGLGTYSAVSGALPSGISLTQINKAATQPIFYVVSATS